MIREDFGLNKNHQNHIDYRYVNPFITSAVYIIRQTTDLQVKRKNIYLRKGRNSTGGIQIHLEIFGDVNGKIVYELSRGVTMRISTRMIEKSLISMGTPEEIQQLLESAMMELTNLISGRAITMLQKYGYECNITPPILTFGKEVELIPKEKQTIVVEMSTIFGVFKINLAVTG
jgi:chemotaxis protein CheX